MGKINTIMRCLECGSEKVVKNGKQPSKQTYLCKDCRIRFTPNASKTHHPKHIREQAIPMFCKGMNIKACSRLKFCKR